MLSRGCLNCRFNGGHDMYLLQPHWLKILLILHIVKRRFRKPQDNRSSNAGKAAMIAELCSYLSLVQLLLVSWIPWWFHVSHCHIPGIYLDSRVQLLFCWVQRLQLFLELFLYPLTLLLYHGTWRFSKQNISAWGMLGISKKSLKFPGDSSDLS